MRNILNVFSKRKKPADEKIRKQPSEKKQEKVALRKGEIGEYKIDIQLSQLPKEYRYINDLMIENKKSISGYSQIDHLVLTPYGIFVIETKNYQGTIYGEKDKKTWLVNGKFKMLNPIVQNYGHIKAMKPWIDNKFYSSFYSIVTFTKRCTLKIDQTLREITANEMVIYDLYLTETITRKISRAKLLHKEAILSNEDINEIFQALSNVNITDPEKRMEHNAAIKKNRKANERTSTAKCAICNKSVSEKVEKYCQSNAKYNGEIYCYAHQKGF
ncbi:nuclease-related domain-containing protein [Virgibacillus sp. LDC-1]|uniref:nuclease-related domain-containing protein n=1 Tax=Virgibacillus sp. LDC-1 TaxID=3039856 RepID=UPI0024DE9435|nr:nuclease-related domain-containing protein [Virgibacillus sp. LDC-1]